MAQQADMLMVMRAKDELTQPLKRAQTEMGKTAKAGKDLGGTFRLMRGGAGQLGHQIQDVAVQAQMGTSAFVILGQQGSQVASLFGPKGALFGAFLAIGAAMAGPLINAITGTSGALEALKDDAKDAAGAFADLNRLQKEQRALQAGAESKDLIADKRKERLRELEAVKELSKIQAKILDRGKRGAKMGNLPELQAEQQRIIRDSQKNIGDINVALGSLFETVDIDAKAKKVNEALQKEINALGKSKEALVLEGMVRDNVSEAVIKQYMELQKLLSDKQAEIELDKTNAKASQKIADDKAKALKKAFDDKKAIEEAEAKRIAAKEAAAKLKATNDIASLDAFLKADGDSRKQAFDRRLEIVRNALDLEVISETEASAKIVEIKRIEAERKKKIAVQDAKDQEEKRKKAIAGVGDQLMALDASNKKVFMMQKAYKIVQATMDARTAFGNALAAPFPPPIPQMLAGAALAMGMANVATIKSQSFEGGGFTGFGARAGGLDGKGGRMAMVHPNETVIDHTKGGASGITVINNVDARGSGADVDQKIKSAMAQTSQQTIMTIQDLIRRKRFA